MITIHPEYVVDENQNKKAVIIPFIEWKQILEVVEELEDIRAYDATKSEKDEIIPFEKAVQEIRKGQTS